MCYERRRAEACVDESAHHALGLILCVLLLQDLLQSCALICVCVCFITAGPITKLCALIYS